MEYVIIIIKLIIGLSILNVWLLRTKKTSPYRGGDAKNLSEEFAVYGLPDWFMKVIGVIKVGLAVLLILSIFYPQLEMVSAAGIAILMLGATVMHFKIGDPLKKAMPAITFMVLSAIVLLL